MLETVSRMFQMAGNNEVWIRKFIKMTLFNQNYLVSILYELKPLIHSRWNNKLVGGLVNRNFMDTDQNKNKELLPQRRGCSAHSFSKLFSLVQRRFIFPF